MTNEEPKSTELVPENKPAFPEQLNPILTGLFYPSESDEPIEPVSCYLDQAGPLTVSQIKDWQMLPPAIYVDEIPEAQFWEPVITEEDWYGDDEKKRTSQFQQLKALLEAELTVRQVFRVGDTERDVYLLGRQADGERAGIKTKIVQT
ncbi:nuclease A inhibitor family protein [Spirosoma rigui]|uniref:nuclease A inhibitor family protein n=1 Tax=Spirosoma rigui TaxID=564064 RepID=UPI0009B0C789|nr:nuclease A inhibitor family protein [Spirosoma rigui]